MNDIIEALLEQRKRLVHELCDVDTASDDWQTKATILQTEIANIDLLIQQFKV